jgi:hypothetical protein
MSEQEDVRVWAEHQAERYRSLCGGLADAPRRWAEEKAVLEATGLAFVYAYHHSEMWELPTSSIPHRVVKKTATRVYVQADTFQAVDGRGVTWQEREATYGVGRTFVLGRADLERDGQAVTRRRRSRETYYARPYEETPRGAEQLERLARRFQEMSTPEHWVEHRRRVDAYLATGGVLHRVRG